MTIVLGAMILLAAKLAACVAARLVYGPHFQQQGYIAADWRTAKLMISLAWILATTISMAMLVLGDRQLKSGALSLEDAAAR